MKIELLALILISVFMITGCDGEPNFGVSGIFISTDYNEKCGCLNLHNPVYLHNKSNRDFKATVKTTYSPLSGYENHTNTHNISANSKKYLGCNATVAKHASPGSTNCSVAVSYNITGKDQISLLVVNELKVAATDFNIGLKDVIFAPSNCSRECLDPTHPLNSGECLSFTSPKDKSTTSKKLENAITFLASKIGQEIPKREIMDKFNVPHDPCSRGNLFMKDKTLVNQGQACEIDSSLSTLSDFPIDFIIDLPEELLGEYEIERDTTKVMFLNSSTAPKLSFSDNTPLTNDYGGFISSLQLIKSSIVITTQNGCLAMPYHN